MSLEGSLAFELWVKNFYLEELILLMIGILEAFEQNLLVSGILR